MECDSILVEQQGNTKIKGVLGMKEEIIEMVKKIVNQDYLKSIYWFVKRLMD